MYGYTDSYATMREKAGVTTHRARHIEMCDKFAQKAALVSGSPHVPGDRAGTMRTTRNSRPVRIASSIPRSSTSDGGCTENRERNME